MKNEAKWIRIEEKLPPKGEYVLLSFENSTIADIGRYEEDPDGGGNFYPGDDSRSYLSYDFFVNAWMPLPEPFREEDEE